MFTDLQREKTDMMRHSTEVLKVQVDLESQQVEQNARLAERRLEEKRQTHAQINEEKKKKLNNEVASLKLQQ